MSSALVWSTESVILGLWAVVFSSYSTPLHVFVARSHVMASSFTLILHLYVKARDLVVGPAVSHAFVCFVTSLFLCYITVLFADGSDTNPKYFKMPSVGMLTLDACIGLSWFLAAIISSIGMVLSGRGSDENENGNERVSLMFHKYGFHLVAVFPCLVTPLTLPSNSSSLSFICGIVWFVYVTFMIVKAIGSSLSFLPRSFSDLSLIQKIAYVILQLCTEFYLVVVTAIVFFFMLTVGNLNQIILVIALLVISGVKTLDTFLYVPFWGLRKLIQIPELPTVDEYFGRNWIQAHGGDNSTIPSNNEKVGKVICNCCCLLPPGSSCTCPVLMVNQAVNDNAPSAPSANSVLPTAPPPSTTDVKYRSMFNLSIPATMQRQPLRFNPMDPAAVSISRRHLSGDGREKNF